MDQTVDTERRTAFRHGALLLLLSALIGLVVASPVPHPAKWMAAHISGLLTGVLIIALGALWNEVRLTPATRKRALQMGLVAAWTGFVANAYSAIVNLPGPATEPGRAPDAAWQLIVFFVLLAIVVPTTLGSFFLVWKGLR
jgi:(hydroxyamino)benzene mutase